MSKYGLRVLISALLVTFAGVTSADTFLDLRRELEVADTLEVQLEVVDRMRAMVQEGTVHPGQVGMVVYVLLRKPVAGQPLVLDLIRDMLADPDLAVGAAGTLANQFQFDHIDETFAQEIAVMLLDIQQQPALQIPRMAELGNALSPYVPQYKRELALEILMARPPAGDARDRYLENVAGLLEPELTLAERRTAMGILVEAAAIGELPRRAWGPIYKVARDDPDASVRVMAWPLVMPLKTERSDRYFFGADLTDQLAGPANYTGPSFDEADEETRERAIDLLNNFWDNWEARYPDIYKDALVAVVVKHGSPAGIAKLTELRSRNELTDEHLAALGDVVPEDPVAAESVESLLRPSMEEGSLMGPLEVLQYSADPEERAVAKQRLLQQYPTGPVPMAVAQAAYDEMASTHKYDADTVALMARGDEPFADKEKKILALVDNVPQPGGTIAEALRILNDAENMQGVVVIYAMDKRIEETFRASLLELLQNEMRDSGDIDPETVAAVKALGLSADNYWTVSAATRILDAAGERIPLRMRLKEKDSQWTALGWVGIGSLVVGGLAALAWLVFVTTPSRTSGRSPKQRLASLGGLLVFVVVYIACALFAVLLSLGHTSTPSPRPAALFYLGCAIIAITMAALTIRMYRSMPPEQGKHSER